MRVLGLIFLFYSCFFSAQENKAFDSLKLKETKDFFADDYGNIYLYKNKDFSLTKYDSLGKQKGKLMLTLPFKIQTVQNPMNIPLFSENAQELKFFDQNLNEIQRLNFREKFGYIKAVYVEDLQQIWLLDESSKSLIQYNFRDQVVVNSFPFYINFDEVFDVLVFGKKVYLLRENSFEVYNLSAEKLFSLLIENGRKIRRENENILIFAKNYIQVLKNDSLKNVFNSENVQIVDKNSASYFVIKDNKLYLYPIKKEASKK